jgi:hypothetical protein
MAVAWESRDAQKSPPISGKRNTCAVHRLPVEPAAQKRKNSGADLARTTAPAIPLVLFLRAK